MNCFCLDVAHTCACDFLRFYFYFSPFFFVFLILRFVDAATPPKAQQQQQYIEAKLTTVQKFGALGLLEIRNQSPEQPPWPAAL